MSRQPGAAAGGAGGAGASYAHRRQLDRYVDVPHAQPGTRVAKYFGMARQVLGQGQAFEARGDLDRAYIFYKRFLRLAVDCLPAHPEYRQSTGPDKAWLVEERRAALASLEKVSAALDAEMGGAGPTAPPPPAPPKAAVPDSVDAAQADLERRLRMLRGGDGGEEGAGVSARQLLVGSPVLDEEEDGDLGNGNGNGGMPEPSAPPPLDDGPWQQQQHGVGHGGPAAEDSSSNSGHSHNPAAAIDFDTAFRALRVSEGGGKAPGVRYYPALPAPPPPPVAPAAKQKEPQPAQGRFAGRGQLRPLVLASGLIGKFLEIAEPNSRKPPDGIETCGVLAGVQDQGQVRFTTLIIPKQEGTSDTVGTTHEEELFFHCEAHGLIMLGWIHTHPSQACFMSSVDIHTHCGYQTMLPEAVAVVVSLRDARKRVGVFRLTEPDGMQLIQQCTLRGFHPHPIPDDQIYKDHHRVVWEDTAFRVVDQRYD